MCWLHLYRDASNMSVDMRVALVMKNASSISKLE